jgi:hypothetical protein
MPIRVDFDPTMPNVFPEPTRSNRPSGDIEDYDSSMIIDHIDELNMTYPDALQTWNTKFSYRKLSSKGLKKPYDESLERLVQL